MDEVLLSGCGSSVRLARGGGCSRRYSICWRPGRSGSGKRLRGCGRRPSGGRPRSATPNARLSGWWCPGDGDGGASRASFPGRGRAAGRGTWRAGHSAASGGRRRARPDTAISPRAGSPTWRRCRRRTGSHRASRGGSSRPAALPSPEAMPAQATTAGRPAIPPSLCRSRNTRCGLVRPPRCRSCARGSHTTVTASWTPQVRARQTVTTGPPGARIGFATSTSSYQEAPLSCARPRMITRTGTLFDGSTPSHGKRKASDTSATWQTGPLRGRPKQARPNIWRLSMLTQSVWPSPPRPLRPPRRATPCRNSPFLPLPGEPSNRRHNCPLLPRRYPSGRRCRGQPRSSSAIAVAILRGRCPRGTAAPEYAYSGDCVTSL